GATEPDQAVKELRRCHEMGAVGVGEIIDKGRGLGVNAAATPSAHGPHADDPRISPIFETCAELGMPVNIHVSDPIWAYQPQNQFNDGLMNAFRWRLDNQPDIMGHDDLIEGLERAVQRHRKTVFIAAHYVNLNYDPTRLAELLDRHPNLYADISARFSEVAAIPRAMAALHEKHARRLVYGTDLTCNQEMFSATFRILESLDEHFYDFTNYHWPQHGLGLSDDVLAKLYRENMLAAYKQARG
ncbi:MAG: amidohydrolase family protein, partial [Planctomycetes bacterium]|nr:amidohydrolase family protein [Planctomycetota bacterium]